MLKTNDPPAVVGYLVLSFSGLRSLDTGAVRRVLVACATFEYLAFAQHLTTSSVVALNCAVLGYELVHRYTPGHSAALWVALPALAEVDGLA